MTDLGLDASQETRITVMQLKIERLEEKQDAQYMDTKSKGVRFFDKKGKGRIKSGKKIYD